MPNSIQVFSLNGWQAPLEVSAKIEEGLDNFDSLFKCDIRHIINSIDARIFYDPNHRKTQDRASYEWVTRRFYFTDDGLLHSEIHEIAHMLDAEAGDFVQQAMVLRSIFGATLFRSHHNWVTKQKPERKIFEEYLCNSRLFKQYPGSADYMVKCFKDKKQASETWNVMSEMFAEFIEEYSFYELLARNQSMVGVMDKEYYENREQMVGYEYMQGIREGIPGLVSDRIEIITSRINLGLHHQFHKERVDRLNHVRRMFKSKMPN